VKEHSDGWQALIAQIEATSWVTISDRSIPVYVRELIARTVPGPQAIADIYTNLREFEFAGRVFAGPRFATANGRTQLAPTPLPDLALPEADHFGGLALGERGLVLSLITARSYGQHNTVVYKPGDSYRGMPHRHTLLINPEDLVASGLVAHQRVTVQGEAGSLEGIELIPGSIRRGAALMFYPEANVLMRPHKDPESGTPAFKRVPVLLRGL
jgi:anaerobic selenocysteine-containing dehydrogenase